MSPPSPGGFFVLTCPKWPPWRFPEKCPRWPKRDNRYLTLGDWKRLDTMLASTSALGAKGLSMSSAPLPGGTPPERGAHGRASHVGAVGLGTCGARLWPRQRHASWGMRWLRRPPPPRAAAA
ncbi:hypothetical protein F0562_017983 [Nyssa sinensis]|uniref:Uncharacterized protein n=1 Tax=Nyssa sinensis TaxID=561372 RepID=A0A5J4ZAQ6_9ASTE|nr:hypothetical protein F0562_017983 [Nyssa sinensis]